jgi:hypothetical protein
MKADFRRGPVRPTPLVKTPAPPRPPAPKPNIPPDPNGYGNIIEAGAVKSRPLTDVEKNALQLAGVDPAEVLPSNMSEILAQASAIARQDAEAARVGPQLVPKDYVKPEFKEVAYEDATPEQQANFRAAAKQLMDSKLLQDQRAAQSAEARVNMAPGIAEALDMLNEEEERRQAAPATPPPEPRETKPAIDETEADQDETSSGLDRSPLCQKCGWDQRDPLLVKPTEKDNQDFDNAFLGFTPNFSKTYPLLKGKAEVVFRTLTVSELNLITQLAQQEFRDGKINTIEGMWQRISRLRIAFQLVSFTAGEVGFWAAPTYAEWPVTKLQEEPEIARMASIYNLIEDHVFKDETLLRAIWNVNARFNTLVGILEARVLDENFDEATGSGT